MKSFLFLTFLFSQFLHCQKKYIFIPSFDVGKTYHLQINHDGLMKDKDGKEYHKYDVKQKVLLRHIQPVNDYLLYSWKIDDFDNGESKCKCFQSFISNLDFQFKTGINGNYLGISNIENLKNQIRAILTKDFIKQFKKTRKDRTDAEEHLLSIKNNPENFIRIIEKDIQKYFRFYNVKFESEPVNYSKLYRNNLSNENMKMPYTTSYKFVTKNDGFYIIFRSELDKKNSKEEDWKTIFFGLEKDFEEFKKRFTSEIDEVYVFSPITGDVNEIKLSIVENTSSHNNSRRIENYLLKLLDDKN